MWLRKHYQNGLLGQANVLFYKLGCLYSILNNIHVKYNLSI